MVYETDRSLLSYPSDDTLEKEVLDHYEANRGKGNDERDNMQKKTFTKWVNKHLTKAGLKVDDLFVDLRDGYALIALLEALTDETIQKEHGNTRFHRIQNVQYCLDFLKKKNVKLVNIRSEDIVEGNGKLTLGLIWTIILHFQVSVIRQRLLLESQPEMMSSRTNVSQVFDAVHKIDATSARVALLQMAQKVTADYPRVKVSNFSSSWRDGLAFNAIIHHYRPAVIDWYKISDKSVTNRERLNNAFHTAEREFGVSRLLDAEDVDTNNPDEKSIITYVSSLYNALPQQPEHNKWQKVQEQYIQEAHEWREWIERAIEHVDERIFVSTTSELIYKLQNFREVDVQPKDEQKKRLCLVYDHLEKSMSKNLEVPRELSTPALQKAWDELMSAIEQRFEVLERQRAQEGASNDIISRLQHGIGITNKKLDLILKRIEELEKRVDSSPPTVIERTVTEIVEELNVLENLIFEEAEQLKSLDHPDTDEIHRQVESLRQRRTAYQHRLNNQILVRVRARTDKLVKIRQTSFSRIEECIEWVRTRMEKLQTMEFADNLDVLEMMFEKHRNDNHEIHEFRSEVDECVERKSELPAEDTYEYNELLHDLESEYQQLRDLSAHRVLDLESLIGFVHAAQREHTWVWEKEQIEVARDWSDVKRLDLPKLTNYFKELLQEMEHREKQYNDVHNQGAALLNQGHPARRVIESYLKTLQSEWDWPMALSKCFEQHLRDAVDHEAFQEEVLEAERFLDEQTQRLESKYKNADFSLEEGEIFLKELEETKDNLESYQQVLEVLGEKSTTISPLWQRGSSQKKIKATAICDYADQNVTVRTGEEVMVLENADPVKWTIRDSRGVDGQVQSVVIRISPPDSRLSTVLNRPLQKFEKLKNLLERKTRGIRFLEAAKLKTEKMTRIEFSDDVDGLEEMLEQQKVENRGIKEFRKEIDEARKDGGNDEDMLRGFEQEYQQLRDVSARRTLDLESLIAFIRAAQKEHSWVWEREQIEVARDWSDVKKLDVPKLTNYYKQMVQEIEQREKQYQEVHNQGAALLNQGHPARRIIESYLKTLETEWDWPMALSKCFEQHLRDAVNQKIFLEGVEDSEHFLDEHIARLDNNYNLSNAADGDRLKELDEMKEVIDKHHEVLEVLADTSAKISPLWQRGERIGRPIKASAICDYADQSLTVQTGDEVVLLDNSDPVKWTIRDLNGVDGQVQSVVIRVSPPDSRLASILDRLFHKFEELQKIWEKKHRMLRFLGSVRVKTEKMASSEFPEDVENLEELLEQQNKDNREIQELREQIDEFMERKNDLSASAEDSIEFDDILHSLETEHQELRDRSAQRIHDLKELIDFVRAAQKEHNWVWEREQIEVARDWSNVKKMDFPKLSNYFKQMVGEMEQREKQYKEVHNQGAALLKQGHPARRVIERYLKTLESEWDWPMALSKCFEQHLQDAVNNVAIMEEVEGTDRFIKEQSAMLEKNFKSKESEHAEEQLKELMETKQVLDDYHEVLAELRDKAETISPLWQRGEKISRAVKATALCDYADQNVTVRTRDEVILLDNSDPVKWNVRDASGVPGQVQSVVIRISPPDSRVNEAVNRQIEQFENLKKLWEKKYRMARINSIVGTLKNIKDWDVYTFASIDPIQRDGVMKKLNEDAAKLLDELEPNDPSARRLEEQLHKTNKHFGELASNANYDEKMAEILGKLEDVHLDEDVGQSPIDVKRVVREQKKYEAELRELEKEVEHANELFRRIPSPNKEQRKNHDRFNVLWNDMWAASGGYVERMKAKMMEGLDSWVDEELAKYQDETDNALIRGRRQTGGRRWIQTVEVKWVEVTNDEVSRELAIREEQRVRQLAGNKDIREMERFVEHVAEQGVQILQKRLPEVEERWMSVVEVEGRKVEVVNAKEMVEGLHFDVEIGPSTSATQSINSPQKGKGKKGARRSNGSSSKV